MGVGRLTGAAIAATLLLGFAVASPASASAANKRPALTGEPVAGTADPASAPDLATGTYLIDLPEAPGAHFRLRRTTPGTTFHVALQALGRGHSVGEGLEIRIGTDAADGGCGSAVAFRPTIVEPHPLLTVAANTWTDDTAHDCATADTLMLAVAPPSDPKDVGRPAQLLVYEEPPVTSAAYDLLTTPDPPTWTRLEPSPVQKVRPGTTTADAPTVGDGSLRFDLRPGSTAIVGIPLGWGQSLSAQLDGERPRNWADDRLGLEAHVIGPMLTTSEIAVESSGQSAGRLRRAAQSLTIAYPNRDSIDPMINGASMAGIHYVAVGYRPEVTGDATTSEAPPLRLTLTLMTQDSANDAQPGYSQVAGLAAPRADARPEDAEPDAIDDERETTGTGPISADADVPWARIGLGAAIVVGAALLLRIGVAAVTAVRRRRRARRARRGRHRG